MRNEQKSGHISFERVSDDVAADRLLLANQQKKSEIQKRRQRKTQAEGCLTCEPL